MGVMTDTCTPTAAPASAVVSHWHRSTHDTTAMGCPPAGVSALPRTSMGLASQCSNPIPLCTLQPRLRVRAEQKTVNYRMRAAWLRRLRAPARAARQAGDAARILSQSTWRCDCALYGVDAAPPSPHAWQPVASPWGGFTARGVWVPPCSSPPPPVYRGARCGPGAAVTQYSTGASPRKGDGEREHSSSDEGADGPSTRQRPSDGSPGVAGVGSRAEESADVDPELSKWVDTCPPAAVPYLKLMRCAAHVHPLPGGLG